MHRIKPLLFIVGILAIVCGFSGTDLICKYHGSRFQIYGAYAMTREQLDKSVERCQRAVDSHKTSCPGGSIQKDDKLEQWW